MEQTDWRDEIEKSKNPQIKKEYSSPKEPKIKKILFGISIIIIILLGVLFIYNQELFDFSKEKEIIKEDETINETKISFEEWINESIELGYAQNFSMNIESFIINSILNSSLQCETLPILYNNNTQQRTLITLECLTQELQEEIRELIK